MNSALHEILEASPEAKRLYETSDVFRQEVDKLTAIFDAARRDLSDEDYAEFLKWGMAFAEEWR